MRQGRIFVSRTDLAGRRRQIQNGRSKSGRDGNGWDGIVMIYGTRHCPFEGVAVFTITITLSSSIVHLRWPLFSVGVASCSYIGDSSIVLL